MPLKPGGKTAKQPAVKTGLKRCSGNKVLQTSTAPATTIPFLNKQISNLTVIGSVNFQVNTPLMTESNEPSLKVTKNRTGQMATSRRTTTGKGVKK